jgi:hypothetical protein
VYCVVKKKKKKPNLMEKICYRKRALLNLI